MLIKKKTKSQAENKGANCKSNAEGDGKKMSSINHLAFFQPAVKDYKKRQSHAADRRAEKCADNRAENENNQTARTTRNRAPENPYKRRE